MIKKLWAFFDLFRKGNELANVERWKDGGNAATLLVPLLMLLVKIVGDFGYGITLTTEEATSMSLGIVAAVQFVLHNITSKRAGILPPKPQAGNDDSDSDEPPLGVEAGHVKNELF